MLVNFKFKNIFSFKELQEFSMVAGSTIRNSERLIKYKNSKILKFTSIFGANASGKSNFVKAITLMRNLVVIGIPQYYLDCYYKLQDRTKVEPSYFETTLIINKKLYSYGFEINFTNNFINSEWLYEIKNDKYIPIFERDEKGIKFSEKFGKQIINRLNFYAEDVSNSNVLLLQYLNINKPALYKYEEAIIFRKVFEWFTRSLNIANPETIITSGTDFTVKEKIDKLQVYLQYLDTGIKSIFYKDIAYNDAIKEIPVEVLSDINAQAFRLLSFNKSNEISNIIKVDNNIWLIKVTLQGIVSFKKLCFHHENEKKYEFTLADESDGTARIIELSAILLTDYKDQVFVIDELDRCLHPQLTKKFIELFLERAKEENNNNQLIVTTHESILLNFDLVRRDEVWFVEKENNESNMFSLEEFDVRFDKKIDKAYLEGRFGGVPVFKSYNKGTASCLFDNENFHYE